jgi:MinD superfamily P-loop ATPase
MIKIAFASGKGGAGKTSLSISFHKYLHTNSLLADCDVDAADSFLLLEKNILKRKSFSSGYKYYIDLNKCDECGICLSSCVFGAIKNIEQSYNIEPLSCEGCGACEDLCVSEAIKRTDNQCGELFESETVFGSKMVYARLIPGEDNSGKLVHAVRKIAEEKSTYSNCKFLVIDCPPGIGCPLIASISGIDLLVVIIECSRSGINDAMRLIDIANKLNITFITLLNKSGINLSIDNEIETFLKDNSICCAGNVPFNMEVINILNRKELLIDSEFFSANLKNIYSQIILTATQGEN